MKQKKHINKTNLIFFPLMTLVAIVGTVLLCVFSMAQWPTWVLAGAMTVACGLSITAGYHRLFAHQAYKTVWPIRLFFVMLGSAAFEGSVLEWATDHRKHHRYTDTDNDPYSVKHGFWHAHMGWLFTLDESQRDYSNVKDLQKSRILRFQHRYSTLCSIVMGLLVPTGIASLWGDPIAGLIIAGALRITVCHHGTFCINSLCHTLGKRPYSQKISARDNWLSALLTFGEGYHNYHHQFPCDYRNGVRFHQYDPVKWLVYSLSCVGLASNLRRIPSYHVIQVRMNAYQELMAEKPKHHVLEQLQASMTQAIASIKTFEKAYAESQLKEYAVKAKQARKELARLFHTWCNKQRVLVAA